MSADRRLDGEPPRAAAHVLGTDGRGAQDVSSGTAPVQRGRAAGEDEPQALAGDGDVLQPQAERAGGAVPAFPPARRGKAVHAGLHAVEQRRGGRRAEDVAVHHGEREPPVVDGGPHPDGGETAADGEFEGSEAGSAVTPETVAPPWPAADARRRVTAAVTREPDTSAVCRDRSTTAPDSTAVTGTPVKPAALARPATVTVGRVPSSRVSSAGRAPRDTSGRPPSRPPRAAATRSVTACRTTA